MKLSKQARTDLIGYSFILPNIIGVLLFTIIPMIMAFIISFTDWNYMQGIGNWDFIGFKNYIEMWSDEWFLSSLKTHFAAIIITITNVLAIIIAVITDKYCLASCCV